MITHLFSVALGGAIGASLRFLVGHAVFKALGPAFPHATLWVNIVGSFLMGVFVVAAAQRGLTYLSPLIMTGLLGGFTTFSAFSLDAVTLMERGQIGQAALYVGVSVAGAILALMAGLWLARGIWT